MVIQDTLSSHGLSIPCLRAKDLTDAVRLAKNMAKTGMSATAIGIFDPIFSRIAPYIYHIKWNMI